MRKTLILSLISLVILNLFGTEIFAVPSCDGYTLNTTAFNTTITGQCSWGGGNLYLSWSAGKSYGYTYNVSTYQNNNATLVRSGGGTFTQHSQCRGTLASQYFPSGIYVIKETTSGGLSGNYSCQYTSVRLSPSLLPTTSMYIYSTIPSSFPTTSRPTTTTPTTSLNITTVSPTPSLTLSANTVALGSGFSATARGLSSTDAVEVIFNGSSVASGIGSVTYTNSSLRLGNYSVVAYDVNRRSYSKALQIMVVVSTTSAISTMETTTIIPSSILSTSATTTAAQNSTAPKPPSSGTNWGLILIFLIAVGAIAYYLMNYRQGGINPYAQKKADADQPKPEEPLERPKF